GGAQAARSGGAAAGVCGGVGHRPISADEFTVACRLRAYSIDPGPSLVDAVRRYSLTPSAAGGGALTMASQTVCTRPASSAAGAISLTSPQSRARSALIVAVE